MNRDYAEKQDLWAEMNDLWVNRQLRRRKTRLSVVALLSVLLMGGVYFYKNSMAGQDLFYLHVKGQAIEGRSSTAENRSAPHVELQDDAIEINETLSI